MSKIVFQISDSGAFSEPDNGIEVYPTSFDTSQNSRYGVVKIVGRKGGVSQYMGANRKQYSVAGVFFGDAESMSTKKLALENLIWNTDSAQIGKSVSMSIIYNAGGFSSSDLGDDVLDPSVETWSSETDLTHWSESNEEGTWSKGSPYIGGYSAEFETTGSAGSPKIFQQGNTQFGIPFLRAEGNAYYSFSFWGKISGTFYTGNKSNINWIDSNYESLHISYFPNVTSTDWEKYIYTGTSPAETMYYGVHLKGVWASVGTVVTHIDYFQSNMKSPIYVTGYTSSQNINIRGYNISQRRGAKNIYDVSIDMEEEY